MSEEKRFFLRVEPASGGDGPGGGGRKYKRPTLGC